MGVEALRRRDLATLRSPWREIDAPVGRRYKIVTVWISEGSLTRLVTAYPAKEATR